MIPGNPVVFQSMIKYPDIKIAKGKTTFIHSPSGWIPDTDTPGLRERGHCVVIIRDLPQLQAVHSI